MKDYKIKLDIDYSGVYSCESFEEAESLAEEICNDVYLQLGGRASVYVGSIEEVK